VAPIDPTQVASRLQTEVTRLAAALRVLTAARWSLPPRQGPRSDPTVREAVFACCQRLVQVQWGLGDRPAGVAKSPELLRLGDHALPDQLTVLGFDVVAALQRPGPDPTDAEPTSAEGVEQASAVAAALHELRLRL